VIEKKINPRIIECTYVGAMVHEREDEPKNTNLHGMLIFDCNKYYRTFLFLVKDDVNVVARETGSGENTFVAECRNDKNQSDTVVLTRDIKKPLKASN
jgi:hypothetical protein